MKTITLRQGKRFTVETAKTITSNISYDDAETLIREIITDHLRHDLRQAVAKGCESAEILIAVFPQGKKEADSDEEL